MQIEPSVCYRALRTRDARFDGRFFVAVRSTGIYCRPVCPARTPRRENCLFVPCAAAAEAAGFRPCRRCRPETAPGTPAWAGTSATVARALRLIGEGALDGGRVGALAERLGIGERHLRRLFLEHLGAPPLAVAQTRRAHFAAGLLADTALPMGQVAFAAGFSSVRRFNDAVRQAFGCTPRELRARRRAAPPGDGVPIRLPYRPPYPWSALASYLGARATPGVERVDDTGVRRALRVGGVPVVVEVAPLPGADALSVRVRGGEAARLLEVSERARAVFDTGADPRVIETRLGADPLLRAHLRRLPGVRVPGAWDVFETAVRCVLGQQVTVAGATRLAGRIAARFGEPLPAPLATGPGDPTLLFPGPEALAEAPLESAGLPRQRAGAVRALAGAVAAGRLDLSAGADPDATREALCALPGIGAWTAEIVALRALREPDAFPSGDLGLRRAIGGDASVLQRRSERWRPWRGYAAMLLWCATSPGQSQSASAAGSARSTSTSSTSKTITAPPGTAGGTPRSP